MNGPYYKNIKSSYQLSCNYTKGIRIKQKKAGHETSSSTAVLTVIWVFLSQVSGQSISSTAPNGQSLCPGQIVQFTCKTRGSQLLSWHIYFNGQESDFSPQFSAIDNEGMMMRKRNDPNTFATLTSKREENGVQVLESELQLGISISHYFSLILVCMQENQMNNSIVYNILVTTPDMVNITSDQRRTTTTGGCVVYIFWTLPSNIGIDDLGYFIIDFNGNSENIGKQVINNGGLAIKVYSVCTCGEHNINITAVNYCGKHGQTRYHIVADPEPLPGTIKFCDGADINTNPPPNTACNSEHKGLTIALSIVSVIFLVPCTLLIILVLKLSGKTQISCIKKLQRDPSVEHRPGTDGEETSTPCLHQSSTDGSASTGGTDSQK